MTFIWAPRDRWLLYLLDGWQLADVTHHHPHPQTAAYSVLLWRAA